MSDDIHGPIVQPGITSSLPESVIARRSRRSFKPAPTVIGAILVVSMLVGSFLLIGQQTAFPSILQINGPVYYVTPQGGPPPAATPEINPGGPMIFSSPTPPFFIDGNLYRNNDVYRADTGTPVRRYLRNLGDVTIYNPQLVAGVLYMAVRPPGSAEGMAMYALRASDGTVLWKWGSCGESVNMSAPVILNNVVYFICQTTASHYDLYALQARTGTRLWLDTFSGEINFPLLADQHTLYVQIDSQVIAESAATGQQIWQRSFGDSHYGTNQIALSNGILYLAQQATFFAVRTSNGALAWEYRFVGDYTDLEAAVDPNNVYLFARQQSGPVTIYALGSVKGTLHWHRRLESSSYGFPTVDQGNLYIVANTFVIPQQRYPSNFSRVLLAIQGNSGQVLWEEHIPWNQGQLFYGMIELPQIAIGGGRIYLADWRVPFTPPNLQAVLGAFSESNGAVLWTKTMTRSQ